MALEDMVALRAVHGSTVLHPSDANQTARLVAQMADRPGISYLRTLRGKTVVRTPADEDVRIGGSRVLRSTDHDHLAIVACGITLAEADKAADVLAAEGIRARVIDCYSIKPIDEAALATAAEQTSGIITVEDHWPQGGLGEAVLSALATHSDRPPIHTVAVNAMPISGKPAELMHAAGIDAEAITTAARQLLSQHSVTSGSGR
jgi:transketolase